ncbi:MAG: DUF58 domain-containing protein, partial [Nitrospirae bacterium]|nr:DUF58 domain-containing protein [Nitrospirota bacterium]
FLLRIVIVSEVIMFPYIEPGAEDSKYLSMAIPKRGLHKIGDVHVCTVFPFNFFIRCLKLSVDLSCLVFPEPVKCALPGVFDKDARNKGETSTGKTGFDGEMYSVRHYRPSDPLKYISWKATAKTGKLKTKEMASTAMQPVMIDFDAVNAKDVEERLSCITFAVLDLMKKNIPVGLKIKDRVFKPDVSHASKLAILRELALLPADWPKAAK